MRRGNTRSVLRPTVSVSARSYNQKNECYVGRHRRGKGQAGNAEFGQVNKNQITSITQNLQDSLRGKLCLPELFPGDFTDALTVLSALVLIGKTEAWLGK